MLRLIRVWPLMGYTNLLLLIVIVVGVKVLATDYTKGMAEDLKPTLPVEVKLSGSGKVVEPLKDIPDLLIQSASDSTPETVTVSPEIVPTQSPDELLQTIFFTFIPSAFYSDPEELPAAPIPTSLPPERWMEWPVIPFAVSDRVKQVYSDGLARGNNPNAFSIAGDCQSEPHLFLGGYDSGQYQLPADSQNLIETILQFPGSFSRWGPAVIDGSSPATVLARSWSTQNGCASGEIPLVCELRIHKPGIVFVNLGTHWTDRNPEYLRQIVGIILEHGAVPILATKADNLEGNFAGNLEMARIATEYDLPLWNFWTTVQDLPHGGLDPYKQGGYMYLVEEGLARRRLSALHVLDFVWRSLNED